MDDSFDVMVRLDLLGGKNDSQILSLMGEVREWLVENVGKEKEDWSWSFVTFALEVLLPTTELAAWFKLRFSDYVVME